MKHAVVPNNGRNWSNIDNLKSDNSTLLATQLVHHVMFSCVYNMSLNFAVCAYYCVHVAATVPFYSVFNCSCCEAPCLRFRHEWL